MQEIMFAHIVHPSNIDQLKSLYNFETLRDTYGDLAYPKLGSAILHMKTLVDNKIGSEIVDTVVVFPKSSDIWASTERDESVSSGPFETFIALKRKD